MSSIRLENVSFAYDSPTSVKGPLVLENINLAIDSGEFVCVLGSSGCGKSTLIRLLEGLNFPTSGRVLIDGAEVTGPGRDRCVVFQHYSLFSWFTARDNVAFGVKQNRKALSAKELDNISSDYLVKVGLEKFMDKYPHQMSGGQQQRVAIARALAMDPEILLMDEPFGAIDTRNRVLLQDMLLKICENEQKKRTVVFITHDVDEAIFLATRIVFMQPGLVRAEIPLSFPRHRVRSELFQSDEFQRVRNQLMGFFYEDIADKLDLTGAML